MILSLLFQVYENEYDLIVKPDINTRGHTQWFYFSVSNTRKGIPVKFNLINMYKGDSLYNRGMRPLMYSRRDAGEEEGPSSAAKGTQSGGASKSGGGSQSGGATQSGGGSKSKTTEEEEGPGKGVTGDRVGWRRCGTDVCYYQNHIKRKGGHYYTASFTITFPHDNDTVYLAYCYPYTYTGNVFFILNFFFFFFRFDQYIYLSIYT